MPPGEKDLKRAADCLRASFGEFALGTVALKRGTELVVGAVVPHTESVPVLGLRLNALREFIEAGGGEAEPQLVPSAARAISEGDFLLTDAVLHAALPPPLTVRLSPLCVGISGRVFVTPSVLLGPHQRRTFAQALRLSAPVTFSFPVWKVARQILPKAPQAEAECNAIPVRGYGLLLSVQRGGDLTAYLRTLAAVLSRHARSAAARRRRLRVVPRLSRRGPPPQWTRWLSWAVPSVRGALCDSQGAVLPVWSPQVARFLKGECGPSFLKKAPASFEAAVLCGSRPLWCPQADTQAPEKASAELRSAVVAFRERFGEDPSICAFPSGALLAVGPTVEGAHLTRRAFEAACAGAIESAVVGEVPAGRGPTTGKVPQWYRRAVQSLGPPVPAGRAARKVFIITGGAQGVGRELALGLAREGASVAVVDINQRGAQEVCREIRSEFGPHRAVPVGGDVRSEEALRGAVRTTLQRLGGLDVMIANAGVLKAHKITDFPVDVWRWIIGVNLVGAFVCAKAAAEVLRFQKRGDIIQINSKSGKKGSKYNSAYAASKFGGLGLVQSVALDLIEDGIRVNAVCPGNFFDLPLWSAPGGLFDQYKAKYPGATREEVRRIYESQIPMGRGCRVADVLETIFYVLNQSYETGQAYNVTGGQEMR